MQFKDVTRRTKNSRNRWVASCDGIRTGVFSPLLEDCREAIGYYVHPEVRGHYSMSPLSLSLSPKHPLLWVPATREVLYLFQNFQSGITKRQQHHKTPRPLVTMWRGTFHTTVQWEVCVLFRSNIFCIKLTRQDTNLIHLFHVRATLFLYSQSIS